MPRLTVEDFERLLEEILEALPQDILQLLDEVPLIVEDEPSDEALRDLGLDPRRDRPADLCGMHWGTPLTDRSVADPLLEPDRVGLYRGPILRLANGSRRELQRQIRITLLHELGHHFGLSEERLAELGYD